MKQDAEPPRGPRPMNAFFVSLAISSVLMGVLLLSDRRVLELRRARNEVRLLDRQIGERRAANENLRAAIEAAKKHEFPAEQVAREELHLVGPDDVVLLYPAGSLTRPRSTPIPGGAPPAASSAPNRPR